jgi:uncharacterized phage-associated protein
MEYMFTKAELECLHSITKEVIENSKEIKEYPYVSPEYKKALETVNIRKCVEVLKYIISQFKKLGYKSEIYNVLKMLYFADQLHLSRYQALITFDRYFKRENGPVPNICDDIIKYVSGDKCTHFYEYDESIKKELRVLNDNELDLGGPLDLEYLSDTNRVCLKEVIFRYGHLDSEELRDITHNDIYDSVPNLNEEITIFHMADGIDKTGELTKKLHELYSE